MSCPHRTHAMILLVAVCAFALGEPGFLNEAQSAESFTTTSLLGQFDANDNGQLDATERSRLRDTFGGIDVPMLPAEPYAYAKPNVYPHINRRELQRMDNTPADNRLTDAGATLGRVLFYDTQLSRNNSTSCASCHRQQHGFTDGRQFSVGFQGGLTKRNSMGLANLRYTVFRRGSPGFFWDERAATLEDQVLMPIQDPIEMGMTLPEVEERLRTLPYYPPLFSAAFGSPIVTGDRIAKAVAQFLRSMESFDARFDRAAAAIGGNDFRRDFPGFSHLENLGKSLFIDGVGGIAEIGCAHCHIPPTFGMPKSLNNGLDLHYDDQGLGARQVPPNEPFTPSNDGKFKAPPLRNIELTAPYMHDGRFDTLDDVLDHYSHGVHPHVNLGIAFADAELAENKKTSGFRLTDKQKIALIAFLKTLTDETFVHDARFSDPFVRLPASHD